MNINENLEIMDKSQKKLVGIPTILLISQLLDALYKQTWLLIDAKTFLIPCGSICI